MADTTTTTTAIDQSFSSLPIPFIPDPDIHGTNRTHLGTTLAQVDLTGFASTVRERYVLHGHLGDASQTPATLFVVHFRLHRDSSLKSRRFRRVRLSLTFTCPAGGGASDDPAILCFAPAQDGDVGVIPTAVLRRSAHNGEATAGVDAAAAAGVNMGFKYGWEKEAEWSQHELATVSGTASESVFARDREGACNVVTWTVEENGRQRRIPDSYQLAVVVERRGGELPVQVRAEVDASVDWIYGAAEVSQRMVGLRRPAKVYDPGRVREIGVLEPGPGHGGAPLVEADSLARLVRGTELDKLTYVHVVEHVQPATLYGGAQQQDDTPNQAGSEDV